MSTNNRLNTFGFEFEWDNISTGRLSRVLEEQGVENYIGGRYDNDYTRNKVTTDGSVPNGAELVSKIITNDTMPEIFRAVQGAKKAGAKITRKCGVHVHIGAGHLTDEQVGLAVDNWFAVQSAVNAMLSSSRLHNQYAKQLDARTVSRLVNCLNNGNTWGDRYNSLNAESLSEHGTFEFRGHQGTLNSTKALAWARFCEGFVNMAEDGIMLVDLIPLQGIRKYNAHTKDAKSLEECRTLLRWMTEAGYLTEANRNWLTVNKLGRN